MALFNNNGADGDTTGVLDIDTGSAKLFRPSRDEIDAMVSTSRTKIMDAPKIERVIARLADEIVERNRDAAGLALIGVRTRGVPLARRIAEAIGRMERIEVPVGVLDITLYRDDFTTVGSQPILRKTEIDFTITGKHIVLVDDVLYTGRTVRAALDGIVDFGRPELIQLAVLVDRGHRELPIRADFVGKSVQTSPEEFVQVKLAEEDGTDAVCVGEIAKPPSRRKKAKAKTKTKK